MLYRTKDYEAVGSLYQEVFSLARDQAVPEEHRAILVDHADYLLLSGNPGQAVEQAARVISNAAVPEKWFFWVLAWAFYVNKQYDRSINALHSLGRPRNAIRKNVIANLVALDRMADAQQQAKLFLEEERNQGIVYDNLDSFIRKEGKLPLFNGEKDLWIQRLTNAFREVDFTHQQQG